MNLLKLSLKPLALLAMLSPLSALATVDSYGLYLPGIKGTENIGGFSDLIPLEQFQVFYPFFYETKRIDATSPLLESAAVDSRHFSSADIYVFDTAGGNPPQLIRTYAFSDVIDAAYSSSAYRLQESSLFAYSKLVVSSPSIGPVSAPELDVTSTAGAISLLVGGLLVLRARWRRSDKPAHNALA